MKFNDTESNFFFIFNDDFKKFIQVFAQICNFCCIMKFALVFAIGIYLLANCHAAVPEKTPKSQIFCSMRSVDLALVLDQSTSIEADEFLELRKFAIDLIARVSLISFLYFRLDRF